MLKVIFARSSLYRPLQNKRMKCRTVKTLYTRGLPWFLFEQDDGEEIKLPASLVKFKVYRDKEGFAWSHDPSLRRRFNIDLY